MKKIMLFTMVFLTATVFLASAEDYSREGKFAVSARLDIGKNNGDSIGQLGGAIEYGIVKYLSAGLGYVYVDGRHPLQDNGLDLFLKGYIFDRELDVYIDAGAQICFSDEIETVLTIKAGIEWQSPFALFIAAEGGAELEQPDLGYLYGIRLGFRLQ